MKKKFIWIASMATIIPSIGIVSGLTITLLNNQNEIKNNTDNINSTFAEIKIKNQDGLKNIFPSQLTANQLLSYFEYSNLKNSVDGANYSWKLTNVDDFARKRNS